VTCIYCLQRPSVGRRRCESCNDYLTTLAQSDSQAERDYGWQLTDRAHRNWTERQIRPVMTTARAATIATTDATLWTCQWTQHKARCCCEHAGCDVQATATFQPARYLLVIEHGDDRLEIPREMARGGADIIQRMKPWLYALHARAERKAA
jgi:hypothetical protein